MLENERWDEVVLMLSPDDFYVAQHRAIFRAMSELAVNGQPLDLITLSEHLEHQGRLDVLGGFAYLAELSKNTPSAANIMPMQALWWRKAFCVSYRPPETP